MDKSAEVAKRYRRDVFIKDDENTVHVWLIARKLEANGLVDAATDTVPGDGGFFDLLTNDDGETLMATGIFRINKRELRRANGLSFFIGVFYAATRVETVAFL